MSSELKNAESVPVEPSQPVRMPRLASRLDETQHWSLLISSSIIVLLAIFMSTKGEVQVIVPIINRPLPPLCTSKRVFNLDCPGCGLTRCFISLAHGDVARAWHYNPAGIWFFALVAIQIPYRAYQLWRIRSGRPPLYLGRTNWLLWVLLVLMLGQWIIKLSLGTG